MVEVAEVENEEVEVKEEERMGYRWRNSTWKMEVEVEEMEGGQSQERGGVSDEGGEGQRWRTRKK